MRAALKKSLVIQLLEPGEFTSPLFWSNMYGWVSDVKHADKFDYHDAYSTFTDIRSNIQLYPGESVYVDFA